MQYANVSETNFIIRLEKGEKINIRISDFCKQFHIENAVFLGIGSCENPTLAHYRVTTKKYSEKTLSGIFEITNITGNVALFENAPLVHTHCTLSDESMIAHAGHLVEAVVSATAEVYLEKLPSRVQKKFDEEIGLKLFDLPNLLKEK